MSRELIQIITRLLSLLAGLFPETELSDEEDLQHSLVPSPQETVPARHTIVPRRVDEKGKEPEEALKQICGICLSEEQIATLQGLLNCCSHYCFTCILEWSKAESRCPLCKRRFNTITVADVGAGLRSTAIRVEKRDQVIVHCPDHYRILYPWGIETFPSLAHLYLGWLTLRESTCTYQHATRACPLTRRSRRPLTLYSYILLLFFVASFLNCLFSNQSKCWFLDKKL